MDSADTTDFNQDHRGVTLNLLTLLSLHDTNTQQLTLDLRLLRLPEDLIRPSSRSHKSQTPVKIPCSRF